MIWFFYHVVVPCWDCFTETVLIGVCVCGGGGGGHNLFFPLENYFRIVPVLPSCRGPCVSPMKYGMKYGIFYKHPY